MASVTSSYLQRIQRKGEEKKEKKRSRSWQRSWNCIKQKLVSGECGSTVKREGHRRVCFTSRLIQTEGNFYLPVAVRSEKSVGTTKWHDEGYSLKKKKKSPVKHFQIKTPHVASCVAFRVNIYVVEGEERWKRFGVGSRASVWRQWLKQDLAVITRVAGITHTAQLPHKFKPSHLSETVVFV